MKGFMRQRGGRHPHRDRVCRQREIVEPIGLERSSPSRDVPSHDPWASDHGAANQSGLALELEHVGDRPRTRHRRTIPPESCAALIDVKIRQFAAGARPRLR
jgi:hypothetical protein